MKQAKIYLLLLALNLAACDMALLDENPDAEADGPLPEGKPGQACDTAGKCPEGYLCIEKSGYPNGKCAAICQTDDDCADDCLICSERHICEGVSKGVKRGSCSGEFQECNGQGRCACSGHRGGENCTECAIGFSGENCQECAANFTGAECAECKPGYYGQNCQKCDCGDKEYCHEGRSGNGECFICGEFYAGLKCNIKIKCSHGLLNPLTGNCHADSCEAGWVGINCDECQNPHKTGPLCNFCVDDYTGADCDKEILCKNGRLDDESGHCKSGTCQTGWTGEDCNECADTFTGSKCDKKILCQNGTLDKESGNCKSGTCQTGWDGEDCSECAAAFTGTNCDQCKNKNRFGEKCDQCKLGADGTTGKLEDDHDSNKKYNTVVIDCREWMAQNYKRETDSKYYPGGAQNNMDNYGLLYDWATASASEFCPSGWRLPTKEEFEELIAYLGGENATAAQKLRVSTWNGGKDIYGFTAVPAGDYWYQAYPKYGEFGETATLWSSSPYDSNYAYFLKITGNDIYVGYFSKQAGYSARCIKSQN